MERLPVNPTRMELQRLKARRKTAVRGHKLLKDKLDEMIRQFLVYAKQSKELRLEVERSLTAALRGFLQARAVSGAQTIGQALMMSAPSAQIKFNIRNLMGVNVPSLTLEQTSSTDLYTYSFASTPPQLDSAFADLSKVLPQMVRLAGAEKACSLIADEIEKNRRRINALEHMIIPQLEETISYIVMKLDENERSGLVRLMKVKSIIEDK